ncbi:cysteine hydrolase family protein [Streptomyces sp. NPDC056549]|uniref:cysteine hydrolase family protein n=1 Tax=Streptomyces sp. NPDC056549 TaxID=3345864 RepID=UPI0036B2E633
MSVPSRTITEAPTRHSAPYPLACPLRHAREHGLPVIYANDNFGRWRSHHGEIVDAALAGRAGTPGWCNPSGPTTARISSSKHAIPFYETLLAYLLRSLGVSHLVLCGQVTEQCVLYSALDAHIRHLSVTVARDAVAHIHQHLADAALEMMEINMGARVAAATEALPRAR